MTDVQPYQERSAAVPVPQNLRSWAEEAKAAHALATSLCQTAFCPEAFRGKPAEATAAILAGSEVGLSPLAALNAYDVIQGRPAPKAITLRAVAQSHGHNMWPVTMTPAKVVMRGQRKGTTEVVEVEWTIKRAQDAKLTGKSNWQTQPQAMLTARCTSELARLIAADVILGIAYSAEELADSEPEPTVKVQRSAATTRVQRAPIAVVPDAPAEPDPATVDPDTAYDELEHGHAADWPPVADPVPDERRTRLRVDPRRTGLAPRRGVARAGRRPVGTRRRVADHGPVRRTELPQRRRRRRVQLRGTPVSDAATGTTPKPPRGGRAPGSTPRRPRDLLLVVHRGLDQRTDDLGL